MIAQRHQFSHRRWILVPDPSNIEAINVDATAIMKLDLSCMDFISFQEQLNSKLFIGYEPVAKWIK